MKKIICFFSLLLSLLAITEPASAAGVVSFIQTNNNGDVPHFKPITLDPVSLTLEEKQQLVARLQRIEKSTASTTGITPLFLAAAPFPSHVFLGMNGVPVLDQGPHGACFLFASTAALDALYGHGDYISQTCYLQLMRSDNSLGDWESGGDTFSVMEAVKQYGIISKQYEQEHGCGGLYQYPTYTVNVYGSSFSLSDYLEHSERIFSNLTVKALSGDEATDLMLLKVKYALTHQHRAVIGVFLDGGYHNNPGIYGYCEKLDGHQKQDTNRPFFELNQDSFVLTSSIIRDIKNGEIKGGHALVVTGYDDDGIIVDADHVEHQGVLVLRNSWGSDVGDNGDFYMSYDYFNALAHAATEISLPEVSI